jgi:hypothetical protein
MIVPALFNSLVFLLLGLLHFYWAAGGKLAFGEALPKNTSGERMLNPTKPQSALVGFLLTTLSGFYLTTLDMYSFDALENVKAYINWIVVIIFSLRAIGDFRYMGFFKKIRNTDFGKKDTFIYSPLCLILATNAALVELL